MVLTRRYKTARFMAQALSVAYAENVTGCKDKQVLFHTTIVDRRTPDFIAFRLANFGGVFSYGQPPSGPHRTDRDLLEEIVENTRSLVRELQALPPWQRFPQLNPEIDATVRTLLRRDNPFARAIAETPQGILGGVTSKSE